MSAVTVAPQGTVGDQFFLKWVSFAFCREEREVSTNQDVDAGDESEGETINSLTPLNVHLMMHT